MSHSEKRLTAKFYTRPSGSQPERDWLEGELTPDDRRLVGVAIAEVEFGWPIGMPSCRPMGDGLFEVRVTISGGRAGRVLFGNVRGEMVLLHGFIKKTQATPPEDLKLARKRLEEVQ